MMNNAKNGVSKRTYHGAGTHEESITYVFKNVAWHVFE